MEKVNGYLGVLVSNVFGKNMEEFTFQDGVWLIRPSNAMAIARLIRHAIETAANAKAFAEKQGTIQEAVYEYVTSPAFRNRVQNLGMQYRALEANIKKTKSYMETQWANQFKLIDQLVTNMDVIIGEVDTFLLPAGPGDTAEDGHFLDE